MPTVVLLSTFSAIIAFLLIFECSIKRTTPFIWNFLVKHLDHRWVSWRKAFIIRPSCPYYNSYFAHVETHNGQESFYVEIECKLSIFLSIIHKLRPFKLKNSDQVLVIFDNFGLSAKIVRIAKNKNSAT